MTILVLGGTGQQGGAVAYGLVARGFRVRALVRDVDKPAALALADKGVELVRGDLDEPASLRAAMQGATGVFSVQALAHGDAENEVRQGIHVADTAKEAGIAHVVYSSVGGAERASGIPHFESKWRIEQHLRGLGVPLTVLRPAFFMENFRFMGPRLVDGTWGLRLAMRPETRLQMIAVSDIATFAVRAFEQREAYVGRAIELAGDELSMNELAQAFTRVSGRPVRFDPQPIAELRAMSAELATMFTWLVEKGYAADIPNLRREHPGLITLETWLREGGWHP